MPWNFAAVCRKWRIVCLASPKLWTKFQTVGHPCKRIGEVCANEMGARRCHQQLQLSHRSPISVDFFDPQCWCSRSLLRAVAIHHRRWHSLHLFLDKVTYMDFTRLLPPRVSFDSLEVLDYTYRN
ncbi:hypothetical protein BDV98DRAFT_561503 [Pterulicium gracile]|uniref:F-box domain-containing protein n=1 Tax=Pterulicium gracile TaxID=1884261 RepID=A0A5C3QWE3_9AGAR|nr:hypothetical protein BDV98DRAFT_561503 [Pterula gracilis]